MVRNVIDFECILPPDESGKPRQFQDSASHRIGYGDPELLEELPGYGFGNYVNIFTKRQAGNISAPKTVTVTVPHDQGKNQEQGDGKQGNGKQGKGN